MSLRVEFLLKTDSGYPKDTGVRTHWKTLGNPSAVKLLGQSTPALAHSRGPGVRQAEGLRVG